MADRTQSIWYLRPELDARLIELHTRRELWFRDITRMLNDEFGTSITRHAVIGRAHRLGLPRRVAAPSPPRKREPKLRLKVRAMLPVRPKLPKHLVEPEGVSFDELGWDACHWPYGQLEQKAVRFCGADVLEGTPWCPTHYDRVYDRARRQS